MFTKKIIDFTIKINGFFSELKPKIIPKEKQVKLNLGCGFRAIPNWYNVDAGLTCSFSKLPKPILKPLYFIYKKGLGIKESEKEFTNMMTKCNFVQYDLRKGIPFVSDCADYIYNSHILEHFLKRDAERFMEECYRVLKKNGMIRICVPDLEYIFDLYKSGEKTESLSYFFDATSDDDCGEFDRHKYLYDFEMLKKVLKAKGFRNIVRYSYRKGQVPDSDILDNPNSKKETLFVEAQK
jgi:predicted SAM-dependent methyltransferase